MRQLRAFFLRLAGIFVGARRDRELADELDAHLAMHVEDNLRAGMTPDRNSRRAGRKPRPRPPGVRHQYGRPAHIRQRQCAAGRSRAFRQGDTGVARFSRRPDPRPPR